MLNKVRTQNKNINENRPRNNDVVAKKIRKLLSASAQNISYQNFVKHLKKDWFPQGIRRNKSSRSKKREIT